MKIATRFFGEVEINEEQIVIFAEGIPGFEELKRFVVFDIEDNENLKCIQSVEDSQVCLLMINPWDYFKDYEFRLSEDERKLLNITSPEDIEVYNIITVREDKITANLLSPVVINVLKGLGKQIILSETNYSIRQEIVCL